MCVKEFIGFNCGHCALPMLRACPLASQSPYYPYCRYPAERPIPVPDNCPACARVVWNQSTLANEESHREVHYRLGREECALEGAKGSCETRFDIDVEREHGGGRLIQYAEYEIAPAPGQTQIETSGRNAERSRNGAGAATMRPRMPRKDRRKGSREIEDTIARVEARLAAVSMKSSGTAAIENALRRAGQPYAVAPGRSSSDPESYAQQALQNGIRVPRKDEEHQVSTYCNSRKIHGPGQTSSINASAPPFEPQVTAGNGYQSSNEVVVQKASPEKGDLNDTNGLDELDRQLHIARLSGAQRNGVQNYIGTTKYYPGEEQHKGACWDEMIANAKFAPGSVVPRGPRAEQERSIQFRNATQQHTQQLPSLNFGVSSVRTNVHHPIVNLHDGQSTRPEEVIAATHRPEPGSALEGPQATSTYPIPNGANECSTSKRPYQGPAIVSSDMANAGHT
ncbi:hypothetical protein V495_06275 [Pseudogymnoascus sp. VKM F-4514 (FW-929)]|nr:hypothetical protein V495_06275 [Pseudogymnoascus sp. VKM F-4514 (FW-929)]KFY56469.1 hypothetical protein V497_06223 [Pseudogymnoascus sp. VKM F-4516 (FW-969)]